MKASRVVLPLVGFALLAAHSFALPSIIASSDRVELAVVLAGPPPAVRDGMIDVRGTVEPSIAARTTVLLDGLPFAGRGLVAARPGLRRVTWSLAWGGAYRRSVGVTRLVGPLQSPDGSCSIALHVGQAFLDDGKGGPDTLARTLARTLAKRGPKMDVAYVGGLRSVRGVRVWWSERARLEGRIALVGPRSVRLLDARSYAVGPSLRASVTLEFERGSVDVEIATISRFVKGELRLEAVVAANAFGRRAIDKAVVSLFRGSKLAVRRAAAAAVQALAALQDALRLPPPIDLGGGKLLRLAYCAERPMEIRERLVATIPLRVVLEPSPKGHAARAPVDLPPPAPPPARTSPWPPFSIDLDLDAVNAMLYDLWATGFLDRTLGARVPGWFDASELAKRVLSIRVDVFKFALPPTLEPGGPGGAPLSLGVEAALKLEDGTLHTPAKLFGRFGVVATGRPVSLDATSVPPSALDIRIAELALTCEDGATLRPCYADLVAEAEREAVRAHGSVGETLAAHLGRLARSRSLGTGAFTYDVAGATMSTFADPRSGRIRLDVSVRARD